MSVTIPLGLEKENMTPTENDNLRQHRPMIRFITQLLLQERNDLYDEGMTRYCLYFCALTLVVRQFNKTNHRVALIAISLGSQTASASPLLHNSNIQREQRRVSDTWHVKSTCSGTAGERHSA